MNNHESTELLAKMSVVWPKANVEPSTLVLWQANLSKIRNADMAHEAVSALMEVTPFWPHFSEFMKVYKDLCAADRRDARGEVVALPPAPRSGRVDPKAEFAKMRRILAEVSPAKRH